MTAEISTLPSAKTERHSKRFRQVGQLLRNTRAARAPQTMHFLSALRFSPYLNHMSILRVSILTTLVAMASLRAEPSPAEQKVLDAIRSPGLSVVHLWAPWCSNCQAELKSGGWLKMVKDNPQVHFYFVSVWNDGEDGRAMLQKFQIADQSNVVVLADPGPRKGENKIRQFAVMPLSWIPTTWIYKGGNLRYALNYGGPFPCAPAVSRRQQIGMVA